MILYPRYILEPTTNPRFVRGKPFIIYLLVHHNITLGGIGQYNIRVATRFPRSLNARRGLVLSREISHGPQFTSV